MQMVAQYLVEGGGGVVRAEVYENNNKIFIEYYDMSGTMHNRQEMCNMSLEEACEHAKDWSENLAFLD
jgi:hypothetical protein